MEWLTQYNIWIQGLILSAVIVSTLITTVTILFLFKIKMPKERLRYVYSFASGFLIVTAIVGQWVTARHNLTEHWENFNKSNSDPDPTMGQTLISILILIVGSLVGSIMAYSLKKLSGHSHHHQPDAHSGHSHHNHSSHLDVLSLKSEIMHESKVHKEKTPVIWMILAHRVPAGLLLGILLVNFNNGGEYSLAALFVFILHTIPDMMIVYFARIKAGYSRKNSLVFSILVKLILIPFILIGIAASTYIDVDSQAWFWVIPLLLSMAGVIMLWGAIFELAPIFIHVKTNKDTYKLIFTFILGLTLSMAIQLVHHH
ncbi:MAG: hypothetical protein HRT99_01750 [Mycoplasmatales bacterium]|nr:hypothetical protein [Mycoplasmatales bacterium]